MNNYLNLIDQELTGDTPKQQYDNLLALKKSKLDLEVKIKSLTPLIDGLIGTVESATIGDVMIWLKRMEEIIKR